jgi:hypothetical protein
MDLRCFWPLDSERPKRLVAVLVAVGFLQRWRETQEVSESLVIQWLIAAQFKNSVSSRNVSS